MKKFFKKSLLALFAMAVMFGIFSIPVSAATRKCYTINSGNTTVYSNSGLSRKYGTIYGSDEVTVLDVTDRYSRVRYPISGGRTKTGYIHTSAILLATSGVSYKSGARVTTYRRPGGASYGYIDKNDNVMILGRSGNYTQVKYPVSGGYKYAFVATDHASRYLTGSSNESSSGNTVSISDGTYVLKSGLDNNKVLDANGNSPVRNGTNIEICSYNGGANQQFAISHVGSGWYKIICTWGNKSIDVDKGRKGNEVNVALYDWHGGDNQLWKFVSAGDGYFYIQSKLGYYLDVWNNRTADGTNVQIYQFNGGSNQKWKLEGASISGTGTNSGNSGSDNSYWDNIVGTILANVNSVYYTTGNISARGGYTGQCTWYAYGRFYERNHIALKSASHAKYWLSQNANDGRVKVLYGADKIKPNCIAVRTTGSYGHVMYVEHVSYRSGNPEYVYYTECNADGNGRFDAGVDCILKKKSYSRLLPCRLRRHK